MKLVRATSFRGRLQFFPAAWKCIFCDRLKCHFDNETLEVKASVSGMLFCAVWHLAFGAVMIEFED